LDASVGSNIFHTHSGFHPESDLCRPLALTNLCHKPKIRPSPNHESGQTPFIYNALAVFVLRQWESDEIVAQLASYEGRPLTTAERKARLQLRDALARRQSKEAILPVGKSWRS
jgi:hypothetical protein